MFEALYTYIVESSFNSPECKVSASLRVAIPSLIQEYIDAFLIYIYDFIIKQYLWEKRLKPKNNLE